MWFGRGEQGSVSISRPAAKWNQIATLGMGNFGKGAENGAVCSNGSGI